MDQTKGKLLLTAVFIARGTSFLFSKTLLQTMLPMNILAVRFLCAFTVLAIILHRRLLSCDRSSICGGVLLGILYTICMTFEMYGLRLIDSGVSSLIENMAIVLVPLIAAVITKTRPNGKTLFCAALAVIGVGFLSVTQGGSSNAALGIVLVILAAITYAICILVTEHVSREGDPLSIGMIQLGTMGVISLVAALLMGDFSIPRSGQQWLMLALLVLVCSCFGFAFQPVGQKYVPAEEAAVLTVVNPLTASVMGILIAKEDMSMSKLIGYILILSALLIYNIHVSHVHSE